MTEPVSQMALHVIGEGSVAAVRPDRDDFRNAVWRIGTTDGRAFVVKRSADAWAWRNEVRAVRHLAGCGLPGPSLHAAFAETLIFADTGGAPPIHGFAAAARGAGRWLRRLHDGRPLPPEAMNTGAETLVLHAVRSAMRRGYEPVPAACPTHGDFCFPNILVSAGGRFLHPVDLEEVWGGDPLADLIIAALECLRTGTSTARDGPEGMAGVLSALLGGYFAWDAEGPRAAHWRDVRRRMVLAEACHGALADWARFARDPDEAASLAATRDTVLAAIETDTTLGRA